ncbi:maturation of Asn-linked oligosaccharides protein [Puccinia graminis f. sp. tritici]|uniref:alpha-1,2-Mannosidase n=1 Tax=Puccinia graminis f. sp. tritici TaxID=56615 RepID=A0A5B0LPS0_PUCGR|nr:maturation of Asn-linked oligosaccharides protein [Puccinia graminis f. sp. tritici]
MTRFNVMGSLRTSVICVLFFSSVVYTLSSGVQKPGLVQSSLAKERQNEVKKVFASAYADYMKFGFPFDEVRPVAKRGQNTRNGWSATLVDSLDTLFIMGLKNEFDQGVSHTLKIDFSKSQTNDSVSLFETTIRYLGGMLSAYELSGSKNTALLKQARTLGDKLLTAWPDPRQNLPFPQLDFGRNRPVFKKKISSAEILIAEAGTLILELGRLSHHTQNPKYLRQAVKAMQAIMNSRSTFPGLAGFSLAVQSQAVKNDFATWGGGAEARTQQTDHALVIDNKQFTSVTKHTTESAALTNSNRSSLLDRLSSPIAEVVSNQNSLSEPIEKPPTPVTDTNNNQNLSLYPERNKEINTHCTAQQ